MHHVFVILTAKALGLGVLRVVTWGSKFVLGHTRVSVWQPSMQRLHVEDAVGKRWRGRWNTMLSDASKHTYASGVSRQRSAFSAM
jgi:hypothetical protein